MIKYPGNPSKLFSLKTGMSIKLLKVFFAAVFFCGILSVFSTEAYAWTASIRGTISPTAAQATGQWRVRNVTSGSSWSSWQAHNATVTFGGLYWSAEFEVEFSNTVSGYAPPSSSFVTLSYWDQSATVNGVYTASTWTASITGNISPSAAQSAGRWRVRNVTDNSAWSSNQTNGATVAFSSLSGTKTFEVEFLDTVSGYTPPASQTFTLSQSSTSTTRTGTYTVITWTASITGSIEPSDAQSSGRWRVRNVTDNGSWITDRTDGATVTFSSLAGDKTFEVQFLDTVSGYTPPSAQTFTLSQSNNSTAITGTYTETSWTASITGNIDPYAARSAGRWRVRNVTDSGDWSSDQVHGATFTFPNLYFEKQFEIEFLDTVSGYRPPASQTFTLGPDNSSTSRTGTYTRVYTYTVTTNITPQAAINAGAQWRVRYRRYGNQSWTYSDYMAGGTTYTWESTNYDRLSIAIECLAVSGGCQTPATYSATMYDGDSITRTMNYTNCPTTTTTSTSTTSTSTSSSTSTSTSSTSSTSTSTTSTSSTSSSTSSTSTSVETTSVWTSSVPGTSCIDISQVPLDTQLQAAPATIMFVLDDSGSMDWETLTSSSGDQGKIVINGNYYEYIFSLSDDIKPYYISQWSGHNKMYYNPLVTYNPWPTYSNASTTAPRSNPTSSSSTLTLSNTYMTLNVGGASVEMDNGGAGYAETEPASWVSETGSDFYLGTGRSTASLTATATWTVTLPESGSYEVFARWDNDPYSDYNDSDAQYTITYAGGAAQTVSRDQHQNASTWVSLGTYNFDATGSVMLKRDASPGGNQVVADAVKFEKPSTSVAFKNSHYFVVNDLDGDGVLDSGESIYLVNLNGTTRTYYLYADNDSDGKVESGELTEVDAADVQSSLRPKTAAEDLQNFANWYSYYRKRILTAKNAVANVITGLSGVRVGFYGINGQINQSVLPVNVTMNGVFTDSTSTLLTNLYAMGLATWTPLRGGLQTVGEYMSNTGADSSPIGLSPYYSDSLGGACQQSFAILITDGYWNDDAEYTAISVGNQDGTNYPSDTPSYAAVQPYSDSYQNTLADVAMKYYRRDLNTPLENLVPTNFPDMAIWQHMVTYAVAFGLTGTLNPDSYTLYGTSPNYPTWPQPVENQQTTIDDLWHATVNGRGEYLSAANPEELTAALQALMQNIESRIGSGASVSINGEEIHDGSTIFQSSYSSDNWTGDVNAYSIDPTSGAVIRSAGPDTPDTAIFWSAQSMLEAQNWDSGRIIGTYSGTGGTAFRYASLTTTQQSQLNTNQVNYLRGNDAMEEQYTNGIYRNRTYKLGDIVHSVPVYFNNYIYAGGNDGMLHAFNANTGQELFAYVPNLVFSNLTHLTSPDYTHRFYVDETPYIKDTGSTDLLVSGLGGGGKGYFCLDVTNPASNTEANVSSWVKWEFPKTGTPEADINDMGYSYSDAYIVNSNLGWVTIFGNGYNSVTGHAVLFILNASDGSLIKKIDVGGVCNGMSTPVMVDANNDFIVDYVYAGDLLGNLWKFDLTGDSADEWDVAYKSGTTPKPVFRAKDASGVFQPITSKPDVMWHCDKSKSGFMVLFGTGKYLGETDFANTQTQTIYGIWDYGDDADNSEYLGDFNRSSTPRLSNQPDTVTLLQQTEIYYENYTVGSSTVKLRVLSASDPIWLTVADINSSGTDDDPSNASANHAGWYFDLPISKERVIRNVIIRDGKLIVVTSIPKSSPCAAGGDSVLMEMDACTGGRLTESQFDLNDDGVVDSSDMITITVNDESLTVAPTGILYPAMIYEPIILRQGDRELKYFSTSAGNIIMLRERAERRGLFYWRELD